MSRRKRCNPICPTSDWDCPYYDGEDGSCTLGDEETMMSECDDAYYILGDFERED